MCLVIITVATTTTGSIYIPNIFNALGSLKYNCLFILLNNPVKWVHFYFYFTDETKAERLRNLFKALQLINNRRQNSNQAAWQPLSLLFCLNNAYSEWESWELIYSRPLSNMGMNSGISMGPLIMQLFFFQ